MVDNVATSSHSTHVAGTIMAAGVVIAAKGMAYQANLRSFDFNSDISEMASEGTTGALVSNHSYGWVRGWRMYLTSNSPGYYWVWHGAPEISTAEVYVFGFYDSSSQQFDQVAFNAPYFLICKAAGNDRNEAGTIDYYTQLSYPADGS